ncbi:MAG: hypothetical protein ACK40G_14870 [Cytophagaceae bacterium]
MKNQMIESLEKLTFTKGPVSETKTEGCCGGAPISNKHACCKLDEEKKAEGESGCGCNAPSESKAPKSSCC